MVIFYFDHLKIKEFDIKYSYPFSNFLKQTKEYSNHRWVSFKSFIKKVREKKNTLRNNLDTKFAVYLEQEKQIKILSINQTKKNLEILNANSKRSRLKQIKIFLFSWLLKYQTNEVTFYIIKE